MDPSTELTLEAPVRYVPQWQVMAGSALAHRMPGRFLDLSQDARARGSRGAQCFQLDRELPRYLEAKRVVLAQPERAPRRDPDKAEAIERARRWMAETLAREHPARFADAAIHDLDHLVASVQEDLVVMAGARHEGLRADPAEAVAAYVHVCLPSGWSPERILGRNFQAIHQAVPSEPGLGFEDVAPQNAPREGPSPRRRLAASMFGPTPGWATPRVRFVWTLTPDPGLDRHPQHAARGSWSHAEAAFLRVERQVLMPLATPRFELCAFTIRVYVYPVDTLETNERTELADAVHSMPRALARYKGLLADRHRIASLIVPGDHRR